MNSDKQLYLRLAKAADELRKQGFDAHANKLEKESGVLQWLKDKVSPEDNGPKLIKIFPDKNEIKSEAVALCKRLASRAKTEFDRESPKPPPLGVGSYFVLIQT